MPQISSLNSVKKITKIAQYDLKAESTSLNEKEIVDRLFQ